jgi:phytoene dehydrogenase-like protein
MTYMDMDPFRQWMGSRVLRRGPDYESFKAGLAERMLAIIARQAPELPELIEDVYTATPLTDQWYTRNSEGAVFGISHDIGQQGTNRPLPRVRLRNLFFTGHSITMPGICGVFINAFDSCDLIRGDGRLFDAVAV